LRSPAGAWVASEKSDAPAKSACLPDAVPGTEGVTATIWVNWIVPLLICEFALQWRRGGPARTG
jgi:hypothetical protein